MQTELIIPHGGVLQDILVRQDEKTDWQRESVAYRSWSLTPRQLCDLELLLNGGFSPLNGFMCRSDYDSVLNQMRLSDGTLWPMPIMLDVPDEFASDIKPDEKICLRDPEGTTLALLLVSDCWQPDKLKEAEAVFGTTDTAHPGVQYLLEQTNAHYLGGRLLGLRLPKHYDYVELRNTPAELRAQFKKLGWQRVVGFQTRNPMHRAHQELTIRAASEAEANLLIHPVVGMTKPGDIDHFTRVRCYKKLLARYPQQTTSLSLLPLAMRMGGPREALWHAIIRKNYGCTHFIVGRDHAGPGKDSQGNDFYSPYAAQELVQAHQGELGISMVPFQEVVYVENKSEYRPADKVNESDRVLKISGTEFRRRLREGVDIPEWFSYPDIIRELRKGYPPKHRQGFTLFFTGLSGAGKSTLANALLIKLMELDDRPVTLLDGDIVRTNLSSELTFSKAHRDLNIQRIGFVAEQITKNRGVAICAPIAPYQAVRQQVRELISSQGGFIEIYVSTPLTVCEQRDVKGLYAKARSGELKGFTGIDDPYEEPESPELVIDTSTMDVLSAVQAIILKLEGLGYIENNRH